MLQFAEDISHKRKAHTLLKFVFIETYSTRFSTNFCHDDDDNLSQDIQT